MSALRRRGVFGVTAHTAVPMCAKFLRDREGRETVHRHHQRLSPRVASHTAHALLHSVGSATSQAASMAGKTLVDLPVARTVTQAWQEPYASWAPAPVSPAAAAGPGQDRRMRLRRAAMKTTIGHPMVKTATTIWLEVAVRAASTPVAQAAVDSMLDAVADIVVEVGADVGKKAALKAALAAAAATRDIATAATGHVSNIVARAEVIPLTSAAAGIATLAATTAANGTIVRSTADMILSAANAATHAAMRACGSAVPAIGAGALRTTVRDTLKAAIKAAVTEAIKELWKSAEQRSEPVPLAP
jgi:hypothetical protein